VLVGTLFFCYKVFIFLGFEVFSSWIVWFWGLELVCWGLGFKGLLGS